MLCICNKFYALFVHGKMDKDKDNITSSVHIDCQIRKKSCLKVLIFDLEYF
jgi:hypothetical protein